MAELALTYRDYTVGWICALEVEQGSYCLKLSKLDSNSLRKKKGFWRKGIYITNQCSTPESFKRQQLFMAWAAIGYKFIFGYRAARAEPVALF
jgi:hypothetical protein